MIPNEQAIISCLRDLETMLNVNCEVDHTELDFIIRHYNGDGSAYDVRLYLVKYLLVEREEIKYTKQYQ